MEGSGWSQAMFFPGASLIGSACPSLQPGLRMLTLFFLRWLISLPWKVDNHCPSERGPRSVLAPYTHPF